MIVYFEDGQVTDSMYSDNGKRMKTVDAGNGYSCCRKMLREIEENYPFETEVYTNSLDALSNYWCWDDSKGIPMIYLRDSTGDWVHITCLTDREIRRHHNLEKMYVNGVFCAVET